MRCVIMSLLSMLLALNPLPVLADEGALLRCPEADWRITWAGDGRVEISHEAPYQPEPLGQPPLDQAQDLILFGLNIHQQPQLYAITPAGDALYCLAVCPIGCRAPVWSADRQRVGFVTSTGISIIALSLSHDEGQRMDIPLDLGTYIHLHDGGQRLMDWSKDLSRVVYAARIENSNQLFSLETTSANAQHLEGAPLGAFMPRLSPDAKQVLFAAGEQLFMLTPGESDLRRLSPSEARFDSPAWSPDGENIAFREIAGARLRLGMMDANGENIRILAEGVLDTPIWAPDSQRIVINLWADSSGDRVQLAVVGLDAERVIIAENAKSTYTPAWTADGASVVYVGALPDAPLYDGLYRADATGQNPPRLLIAPIAGPGSRATAPAIAPIAGP